MRVVKFYAKTCGPCKVLGKMLEEIKEEYNLDIVEVDACSDSPLVAKYNVRAVPTLVVEQSGKSIGMCTKEQLINFIKEQ